jgi:predicted enzyme related to lactoylglutathione lyase
MASSFGSSSKRLTEVYARARALGAQILVEPHENAEDGVREFTLRDPDGYAVAIIEETARV